MAIDEFVTYARDFVRLDYPASWTMHENRVVGQTDFCLPVDAGDAYPPGIALMLLPETGMALEPLLRTGIFFLLRDLESPAIQRLEEDHIGALEWYRLRVQGYADAGALPGARARLHVTKHVALSRPGPGVVVLALYGPSETIEPLVAEFERLQRSVRIAR